MKTSEKRLAANRAYHTRNRDRILERQRARRIAKRTLIAAAKREQRRSNRAYIQEIRKQTVCAQCGGQPIDWHRPEHEQHPLWRLGSARMAENTRERIDLEISLCTPLCRRCHMNEDGRLAAFVAAGGGRKPKRKETGSS